MEALQRLHNRGSISTGYDIEYSLKNEQDNGERFESGNWFTNYSSTTTYTFSMWIKRTEIINRHFLSYQANTGINVSLAFANDSSTQALYYLLQNSGSTDAYGKTTALFRDTSAWYHIVWRVDTTQATAADRVRIYVNGVQQDLESGNGSASTYPSQNYNVPLQQRHYVLGYDGSSGFCGYCSEYYFIDGQSLAPTEFGEFDSATGIWKPIEYTGTFGNEGYYLDFADASALGKDVSPNNQGNFIHYGGSSADQATDTPTNNFVTWIGDGTPWNATAGDNSYTKDGATTVYHGATTGWSTIPTTQGVYGGKWYAELKWDSAKPNLFWGVLPVSRIGELPLNTYLGATDAHDGFGFYTDSTRVRYYEGTVVSPPQNLGLANGDIIQVAMDKDNGYVYFGINNTWTQDVNSVTGVPTSGSSGTGGWAMNYDDAYCFAASLYNPSASFPVNFGGYTAMTVSSSASDANGYGNFEYAPPSGYYALCSKNLAEFGG